MKFEKKFSCTVFFGFYHNLVLTSTVAMFINERVRACRLELIRILISIVPLPLDFTSSSHARETYTTILLSCFFSRANVLPV